MAPLPMASISSPIGRDQKMSRKAFAVIIKPLLDLHGTPQNWAAKVELYYEALGDVPEDLLHIAVKHAIATNAYFPKPAELRSAIAGELAIHHLKRDEARRAALPRPPEPAPPTPEDIAHVAEQMRKIRENLSARTAVMKGD